MNRERIIRGDYCNVGKDEMPGRLWRMLHRTLDNVGDTRHAEW